MRRLLLMVLPFPLLPLAFAQMQNNYSHQEQITWGDNTSNCVAGKNNCWHLGNNTLSLIASDGPLTIGANSSGTISRFNDYPSNSWTALTGLGTDTKAIAVSGTSTIYKIGGVSSCTTKGGGGITYAANSGYTAWTPIGGCQASFIAGASDGTVVVTDNNGLAYKYTGSPNSWKALPSTPNKWSQVSPQNAEIFYGLDTKGYGFSCTLTACTPLTGSGGGMSQLLSESGGTLYARVNGTIYSYKPDGSGWNALAGGPFTTFTNGGTMHVWAIGPTVSGSNVWRYPDQGMTITTTITGSASCNLPNCPSATHTPHASVAFSGKHTGNGKSVYGIAAPYQSGLIARASDTLFDPFICAENEEICLVTVNDGVDCTVGGNNFFDATSEELPIDFTIAEVTHARLSGPPANCSPTLDRQSNWCWYPVAPSCPNPGPYMFFDVAIRARQDVADAPPPAGPIAYWLAYDLCLKYQTTGWTCIPLQIDLGRVNNPNVPCTTPY